MVKKKVLVKISGDAVGTEGLYAFLSFLTKEYKLYIICGAGSETSKRLREEKVPSKFIAAGRVIKGERGRKIALEILEEQRKSCQKKLNEYDISAIVHSSEIKFGDMNCRINGDTLAVGLSVDFYKTFVVAVKEKDEKKQAEKGAKKAKLVQEGYNVEIIWL